MMFHVNKDVQQVVAMKPNAIDILDIERRALRACRTIRALPDRDKRFFAPALGVSSGA
jgi:hypothetical protein